MMYFRRFVPALAVASAMLGSTLAHADVILTFGQNGGGNTITGTDTAGTTTINGSNISISVTGIDAANPTPFNAFLTLSTTSIGSATLVFGNVVQEYSGSFCITSLVGCLGTNYLSGNFTDAVFGASGGAALTMSAAQPTGSLVFTSDVIGALGVPRGLGFSFANVSPAVHIAADGSLASFTSSVSGTMSATPPQETPEPATLGLLGIALAGLGFLRARKQG